MKTLLLIALLCVNSTYAGDKPAPRASPVDPKEKQDAYEKEWKDFERAEHLSIKQITDHGYTFIAPMIRNRSDSKGTLTTWVFQGTSLYPFPMHIEVGEYPSGHELNVATLAAQEEANVAYEWMKKNAKALITSPSPKPSPPINKWIERPN